MLVPGQVLVSLLGSSQCAFFIHSDKCIQVTVAIDTLEEMACQLSAADLTATQHVTQGSQVVPMGHNKKGSVRKSQHRAGLVSLNHPRNQVQAVLNLWRALLK